MSMIKLPERKELPEEQMMPCPKCGTMHKVVHWVDTYHYLDGMYQLGLEKWAQRYVICTSCGTLYGRGLAVSQEKVACQNVSEMSHAERVLLTLIDDDAYSAPLWEQRLPHVYAGIQHDKYLNALQKVAQNILSGKESPMRLRECGKLQWQYGYLMMYPEVRLVDIYRQMGEWQKANEQIRMLRRTMHTDTPDELKEYLKLEESLIQHQDSKIQ